MKKADLIAVAILLLVVLLIFYPICFVHYFYTDEIVQLWLYKKGSGFAMFRPQGRLLTDWLFRTLFGSIHSVAELSLLRIFSLAGWLLVIPVWYTILHRIAGKEALPRLLPFFTTLYLATCIPVSISIQWASTMELFIAYTAGLIAGYCVWLQLDSRNWALLGSALVWAMISLFSYQNGFGCFMLPLFLRFLANRGPDRKLIGAVVFYIGAYMLYFLLFKLYMAGSGVGAIERTALGSNPVRKVGYFLLKSLPSAFYFNVVVRESSRPGRILYGLILVGMMLLQCRKAPHKLLYIAGVFAGWILIYLPSLIVKEDFSSNRTLLALDLAVFVWVFIPLLDWADDRRVRMLLPAGMAVTLIFIARYNLSTIFLPPATDEYNRLSRYIRSRYHPGVDTVYYIRTGESFVRDRYKIASSWDEYGFSSSYFVWVPEFLVKQEVFEKTGDRAMADAIHIISDTSATMTGVHGNNSFIVDAPTILRKP